jgi:hypothetical protein
MAKGKKGCCRRGQGGDRKAPLKPDRNKHGNGIKPKQRFSSGKKKSENLKWPEEEKRKRRRGQGGDRKAPLKPDKNKRGNGINLNSASVPEKRKPGILRIPGFDEL